MPTITVYDPSSGRDIRLMVRKRRNGDTFYQRVNEGTYDLTKASSRQLETHAAFAEAASTAFGKRMIGDLPPATDPVRTLVPERMKAVPRDATASERRQEFYRSLLAPEERELLETMRRQKIRGQVARRAPSVAPLSERPLGELRMMQAPPGY